MTTDTFRKFIDQLGNTKVMENVCNMYSFDSTENEIRRNNLLLYFQQMAERKPEVMIIGEAPGYQGCRWTGIGFCSEYIMLSGLPEIGMFGKERGYRKTKEWDKIWKEPSATIVWKALLKAKRLPLIWASYPFHPHRNGEPMTNRAPSMAELKIGERFIREVIKIFGIKEVIAVGNKAEITLATLGIVAPKIRHPANGGANLFNEGVVKYLH